MRIISARPCFRDERTVATVDVAFDDHLKLYGITIRRAADGSLRAWPPKSGSNAAASISADLARTIIKAAMPLVGGAHVKG
ncbi:hypothetical protein ACLBXM_06475 [Xanthobacteraceae bacterium A53D]